MSEHAEWRPDEGHIFRGDEYCTPDSVVYHLNALEAELAEAQQERDEARDLARNLFNMIDRETWRATGGDDGQGHYEGDGYAERVDVEIRSWQRGEALASGSEGDTA